ncbi:hypothetical protein MK489_08995 [Myxococcota bacterium]|nr:hypothetical protein [Myxococcota bacterium]
MLLGVLAWALLPERAVGGGGPSLVVTHPEIAEGPGVEIVPWGRGFKLHPASQPELVAWFWFYEWNLFGAVNSGLYTPGVAAPGVPGEKGAVVIDSWVPGIRVTAKPVSDGVELLLEVRNETSTDWPELASLIPCFAPRYRRQRTRAFENQQSFFVGGAGLESLSDPARSVTYTDGTSANGEGLRAVDRVMHFNHELRRAIDGFSKNGRFPWSVRWPTSSRDARAGLLVRESRGPGAQGGWVMGVAWERYLSAQGHNSNECLHLSVRVGPLARGESRTVRGKLYLFRGTPAELLKRYESDFGVIQPESSG